MASHLKTLRKRRGLSVEEVATRAGTSPTVIVQDENFNQRPGPELERKIADAIGFPVGVIWPDDTPQAKRVPLPLHLG